MQPIYQIKHPVTDLVVDRFGKRVITIESGHVINDRVGGYVGGRIHGQA